MRKRDQISIAYFGEGCASEGDIPSALNIAAVHGCPTIYFCRNNGYAISTSTPDDDSKYRNPIAPEEGWGSERAYWEARSPIIRFGRYLQSLGWFNVQME